MFPPISSPTSPQDVQMTDLNILNAAKVSLETPTSPIDNNHTIDDHSPLSSSKSTNTLRNNIDVKNERNKKRTSLNLNDNGNGEILNGCESSLSSSSSSSSGQQQKQQQPLKLATVKRCSRNLDNARYRFEQRNHNNDIVNNNNRNSSTDSDTGGDTKPNIDANAIPINDCNENSKLRRLRRKTHDKSQKMHVTNNDSDGDENNVEYNDRQNGNASDVSTQKRDSVTSKESSSTGSSDDYFLCEKFKNSLNTKLCDDALNDAIVVDEDGTNSRRLSLELLSPHEGPLGRRYAEIATNKGNSNGKW